MQNRQRRKKNYVDQRSLHFNKDTVNALKLQITFFFIIKSSVLYSFCGIYTAPTRRYQYASKYRRSTV